MRIGTHIVLALLLVSATGCVMYPRYYSTGDIGGRVIDQNSHVPVSNALVVAEVLIRNYDAMGGESPKRVASAYDITDANGEFSVPSMSTLYLYFAAILRERKATGHVSGVYHPSYTIVGRTNDVGGVQVWNMTAGTNTAGLDQVKRHFTGWHSLSIKRADRKAVQSILRALVENDPRPNKGEYALEKRLLK